MSHILIVGSGYEDFRRYILEGAARDRAILLSPEPVTWQEPFVQSAHHVDFRNREALYATARALAAEHDIDGIATWDETLLETAADLGVLLGVRTISPTAARACRDKAVQRAAFARAGVPSVRFQVVGSPAEAADAAAGLGFPVVVKPTSLAGSVGVRVVRSPAEIPAAWEVATSGSYSSLAGSPVMVEEMMVGPEISVDCWTLDGVCTPVVVAHKQTGFAPYFEETGHVVGAPLASDTEGQVIDAVSRANLALGIDRCVTHTEVILGAEGPQIVEVNGRLGGGLIPFLAELAAPGLSIWQVLASVARGRPGELVPARRVAGIRFLYPPNDLVFERIDIAPELQDRDWIDRVTPLCAAGTELRLPPRGFLSRAGYVIVTGPDRTAVENRLTAVDKSVTVTGKTLD
jgi:biotin carboxylase